MKLLISMTMIASIAFVYLVIVLASTAHKKRKRIREELSGKAGVYKDPAGEPLWNGNLPDKVENYTVPRYVYENMVETTEYNTKNGRVIGYRISPTLVIHSRMQNCTFGAAPLYRERLGGELLEFSDIKILAKSWQELSELRVNAGEPPLEEKTIYATHKGCLVICDIEKMSYSYPSNSDIDEYLLILKR